ncbi:hypothetical protein EBI_25675 [Enterocytozoon bieneusi H348]|nr:hypothetical protein EBI_25675 [Enterocytozoon bieneusi H348]|eukprot:XP_002650707.1 hypothetical protein EBI_25675 [Enterocytozoon bieneusi H348]
MRANWRAPALVFSRLLSHHSGSIRSTKDLGKPAA